MYFGSSILVGGGISVRGCGKTDAGTGGIEHTIEALGEWVAINKVEPFATWRTKVVNDEIQGIATTTNVGVENTRPELAVGCEREGCLCKW